MLVKWIRCRPTSRDAFHRGQLAWAGLRDVPGFRGQCGGWSDREAHVFGRWSGEAAYRAFMAGPHDRFAAGQAGAYDMIDVRLFEQRLTIGHAGGDGGGDGGGGGDDGKDGDDDGGDAAVLRLAHCHVRDGRTGHFAEVQATVWNPGMAARPGMRGGVFAQRGAAEFLVLSRWRSAVDHAAYLREAFPALRERSGAAGDLAAIEGALIELEPAWTVAPGDQGV
jgi:heme-degrading monooxygenase HmoA